jgi:hypothetical protein
VTFLAPWALLVGALAAAGLVALHLVARQRPASFPLPTARFVPDRRTLVSRVSRRPRDLLLLLLRVVLVLSAAAAFARPVLTPRRTALARVLVLDRSAAVADPADALRRAREIMADDIPTQVLVLDSSVVAIGSGAPALDSLAERSPVASHWVGSISAALAAARRIGAATGVRADSVEFVLVSPLTERQVDAATDSIRAAWPGAVRLARVSARIDSAFAPSLERAIADADVLGPALAMRAVQASAGAVRLVRGPLDDADSAFARRGGAVVRWDSPGTRALVPSAVAMGDDVVVATLGRDTLPDSGVVLARWADGAPAAVEQAVGNGCVRVVGIGVPVAGDLPLSPAFQRIVNGLTDHCVRSRTNVGAPLDSARVAALVGRNGLASGSDLADGIERPAPIAPWLLGLALACALAELLLRRTSEPEAA